MVEAKFARTIEEIGRAEKEKEALLRKANSDAEKIIANARAGEKDILEKAEDKANELQNKILADARQQLQNEEAAVLKKAEKEAAEIGKIKLNEKALGEIASKILK